MQQDFFLYCNFSAWLTFVGASSINRQKYRFLAAWHCKNKVQKNPYFGWVSPSDSDGESELLSFSSFRFFFFFLLLCRLCFLLFLRGVLLASLLAGSLFASMVAGNLSLPASLTQWVSQFQLEHASSTDLQRGKAAAVAGPPPEWLTCLCGSSFSWTGMRETAGVLFAYSTAGVNLSLFGMLCYTMSKQHI